MIGAEKGGFRLLKTDEWWVIALKPDYYDLCDLRVQLLEKLTRPDTQGA